MSSLLIKLSLPRKDTIKEKGVGSSRGKNSIEIAERIKTAVRSQVIWDECSTESQENASDLFKEKDTKT